MKKKIFSNVLLLSLICLLINGCSPDKVPTSARVEQQTDIPIVAETNNPTANPTLQPTTQPTKKPTAAPVATAKPVVKAQAPKTSEEKDITVYVTKTGKKYHRNGCQYLEESQIPIFLSEAKTKYSPCSKCNPPR